MSYFLTEFDGLTLGNAYNGADDVGGGQVRTRFVPMAGGGQYDGWETERAPLGALTLTKKGDVVSTSAAQFRTNLNAIKAKLGKRGVLTRVWDDATEEWCMARLIGESASRSPGMILDQAVELTFAVISPCWYSETINTVSGDFTSTSRTLSLPNDGNAPITNAVITLTSPATNSVAITSLTVSKSGQTYFTWAGSLAANTSLVIDCGARSVKNNGVDAYTLIFSAAHTITDWLRLDPGANSVVFTVGPLASVPIDLSAARRWHGTRVVPTYSQAFAVSQVSVSVAYYDGWI